MKLNYIVLGTNDLQASSTFYNALFDQSGVQQIGETDRMFFWQGDGFSFAIAEPFDQNPASSGNGTMIGFELGSPEEVDRLYSKALILGAVCEGRPSQKGPRYSGYVRDLDQNKICFFR